MSGDAEMKAIVQTTYNGIDALQLMTRPDPTLIPLAVKVTTHYTPVMPYDLLTETGALKMQRPVHLPMVIGYGFGGVVTEVGQLRKKALLGQRVIGFSLKGSHQTALASALPLFSVPQNVSLAAATTLIGGADAAMMAIRTSRATKDDVILVTGASGSVGTYLLQLLHHMGVRVIAMSHSSEQPLLTRLGADWTLAYDKPLQQQLTELPPATKIIDLAGSSQLLDQLSQMGPTAIWSLANPDHVPQSGQSFTFASGRIRLQDYHWLLDQLAQGTLQAVIQNTFPFTAVKSAQHELQDKHSHGRILLNYR